MALELPSWVVAGFNLVGLPWPGIDEDQLREWAASVRSFAGQVNDSSTRTHSAVAELAASSQSSFTSAIAAQWEDHSRLVADLQGPMHDFAGALDIAADAVVAQKGAVIAAAATLATEFAATQVGAFFTVGMDETAVPAEVASARALVKAALNLLEGELIGTLAGSAVQAISGHVSRFLGSLLSGALPVAAEAQSLKISYAAMDDAAQAIRGHASETERAGGTACTENAGRDLEDRGAGGRWPVTAAVRQALDDLAGDLFRRLPGVIARAQEDAAGALTKMAQEFEDEDSAAGSEVPEIAAPGPPAEPPVGSAGPAGAPGDPGGTLLAGPRGSEPDLVGAGAAPGASDAISGRPATKDPVDLATGDVIFAEADVTLPGALPLVLERAHRSSWRTGRWFGRSWLSSFDQRLVITAGQVVGAFADGRVLTWVHPAEAGGTPPLPLTGPAWPLRRNPGGSYAVTDPQRGLTWRFEPRAGYQAGPGDQGELPLVSLSDRAGREIVFSYDAAGQPFSVSHSSGHRIQVTVADGQVTALTLAGRGGSADVPLVAYTYDEDANLAGVVNSSGQPLRFGYDAAGRLTGWTDRNGQYYRYSYDRRGRCVRGDGPGGALSGTLDYEPELTRWTDAAGAVTSYEISPSG